MKWWEKSLIKTSNGIGPCGKYHRTLSPAELLTLNWNIRFICNWHEATTLSNKAISPYSCLARHPNQRISSIYAYILIDTICDRIMSDAFDSMLLVRHKDHPWIYKSLKRSALANSLSSQPCRLKLQIWFNAFINKRNLKVYKSSLIPNRFEFIWKKDTDHKFAQSRLFHYRIQSNAV